MRVATCLLVALAATGVACRQDMHDQPRYEPYEKSSFFRDGRSMRPQVEGTVARGELFADDHLYRGKIDGDLAETYPFEITREILERGRERFGIYCAPCHDETGSGNGIVVQRGMKRPESFHSDRLVDSPPGYFFDVITNGFGVMYDYADRVPAADRWAIAAFVQTLQRARRATLDDVPQNVRASLLQEAGR